MSSSRATMESQAIDAAELRMRIDLAACCRLVALYGMDDLLTTRISGRLPEKAGHFLINPSGLLFRQVRASNLVEIDPEALPYSDRACTIDEAGFLSHSAIYTARPDVVCIIHTNTVAGMAVSCLEEGLVPLQQKNMRFHRRLAYHDYAGLAEDPGEGARMARDLGPHEAMILRDHGLLTCGGSVRSAFRTLFDLEKTCQVQLAAMATRRKLRLLADPLLQEAAAQFGRGDPPAARRGEKARHALEWASLLSMLDGIDPGYRQ
jgi:ribulose-5-phosphate 4-epimerase/fuculose-1-phosphate aldolase